MREIKFRAWLKGVFDEEGDMVYFDLFSTDGNYIIKEGRSVREGDAVMQYTGLTDKKGVEIYEGDILDVDEQGQYGGRYKAPVKWISYNYDGDVWAFYGVTCFDCKGEPTYHDTATSLYTRGFLTRRFGSCIQLTEMTRSGFGTIEVIGNVHENPELLEGSQC